MKKRLSGALVGGVIVADLLTKRWALETLADGTRLEWLGGLVPITLTFNRGAAFGLSIGNDPRWFFIPITLLAIGFLGAVWLQSRRDDYLRITAVSLILGGAVGNLYDRVRWSEGVVDFIGPIDLGFMHWPIFNVADMGITCGAILLGVSFWKEESEATRAEVGLDPDRGEQGAAGPARTG